MWTAVNFLLAIIKPFAARGSLVGDIVGWLLGRTPSETPRTVNPGVLATDVRALISHTGAKITADHDTVNLLGLGVGEETAQAIIAANGGVPEKSTALRLQEMAEQATQKARLAVEEVMDKVVDAVPAHVIARLDGNPMLLQQAAELLCSKVTDMAKQIMEMSLGNIEEVVATAAGDVEAGIQSLESEMEPFYSEREEGISFPDVQLEAMKEAKGGATDRVKERLKELLSAQVDLTGFDVEGEEDEEERPKAVFKTLCGFKQGQTEADLSGRQLGPGDALLIAWDLAAGAFVSTSLTNLSLRECYIGKEGAAAVAKALEVNASLKSIDLSRNRLEKESAIALAKALEVNASITNLNLAVNGIGKDGAVAVAKALEVNASITKLK